VPGGSGAPDRSRPAPRASMRELPPESVTTAEIREMDRVAIEEFGIPGVVLMENAGAGAAALVPGLLGAGPRRAAVLAGRGNNGGDAFVLARHLANRGIEAECFFAGDPAAVDPRSDAGVHLGILRKMGLPVREVRGAGDAPLAGPSLARAGLIVDGLLGTGARGEVREPTASLIDLANRAGPPILALDLPSGLDADTGRVLGRCVRAACTATFVLPKAGFFLGEGPAMCGDVRVIDIGMPRAAVERVLRARRPGG
ncbi:MAG: NAD(P)H-hydrate epimerase, partial [Planctomycetes bacterium]|nr:NAD(P)H-hydrate epimerase [Planctomycetota bacterium]